MTPIRWCRRTASQTATRGRDPKAQAQPPLMLTRFCEFAGREATGSERPSTMRQSRTRGPRQAFVSRINSRRMARRRFILALI